MKVTIWGKYKDKPIERIDTCSEKDASYLLREYKLAFGANCGQYNFGNWELWIGKKQDCPSNCK